MSQQSTPNVLFNCNVKFIYACIIMLIVELIAFHIVYHQFSLHLLTDTSALNLYYWPEMGYNTTTNFHAFELIAAFAYFFVMTCSIILFSNLPIKKLIVANAASFLLLSVLIYIAATFFNGEICHFLPGGACWHCRVEMMSPFSVVVCGMAYAIPFIAGFIVDSVLLRKITHHRLITSIFIIIATIFTATFSAFIFNLLTFICFI